MKVTPMMRQFLDAKEEYPDCVLFFRMGDFYETFLDDAVLASRELGVTLTARDKKSNGEPIPMAGVPHHAAAGYIRRLVEKGFSVAICEQLENPAEAKGIVKRGVVRVVTPGTLLDEESLDAKSNHYLVSVAVSGASADVTALAAVDASTGELRVCELQSVAEVLVELRRLAPRELLCAEGQSGGLEPLAQAADLRLTQRPDSALSLKRVVATAEKSPLAVGRNGLRVAALGTSELRSLLAPLADHHLRDRPAVESALALIFEHLIGTQGGVPRTIAPPQVYRSSDYVVLDSASAANLEIFETLMGGRKKGSLIQVIDRTVTAAGGRRLRTWLSYPLVDPEAIRARQGAVSELTASVKSRAALRELLADCYDIHRLCGKLTSGQGNARDLTTLGQTLVRVPKVKDALGVLLDPKLVELRGALDACEDLAAMVTAAIVEDPPVTLTDGGLIREGYSDELDQVIERTKNSKRWLLEFEARQREETGISSIKVKHNKVFGYYIEVTRSNLDSVPEHYIRKQTLANAERYFTPELKEEEEAILSAAEIRGKLEYELFEAVRRSVIDELNRLRATAEILAELDALVGLAELSHSRGYVCPEIRAESGIEIRAGRHPVVETMLDGERFVPNDISLTPEARLQLITGPNMAGKSTVIRQVALITLLAQIGSHVPARSAIIGVVDQIFSRVGASDNLARGQSTFMVEMSETAHILANATERSLVILDEIGRGTATFDGLSIAWAVAEHLHDDLRALTLFATHYHELTTLTESRDGVRNLNVAAKEWNDDIIFLHTLLEGSANRSYGIQVARLAGVPAPVVARAREVLATLDADTVEEAETDGAHGRTALRADTRARGPQLGLFSPAAQPDAVVPKVVRDLSELPLDAMSPIEALNTLYALRRRARKLSRNQD